jgi:protein-disulfide isomerase
MQARAGFVLLGFLINVLALGLTACAHGAKQAGPQAAAASPQPAAPPAGHPSLSLPHAEQSASTERIFSIAASESAPTLGRADAKVTVEVCSDFECPFCARLVPTIHELVENYGELVRVVWRNCPLPFHPLAMPAAEAALEVFVEGGDAAFWAYHDVLFAHQSSLEVAQLPALAKGIAGVDAEKLKAALADHRHLAHVRQELSALVDSGAASGGFGTPATFINGRLLEGAQPYEAFEQAVERALIETPEAHAAAKAASDQSYPMARASHILIQYKGARGADPKVTRSQDEARVLAESLALRLAKERSNFAGVAREKSDCPSAAQGGELGRITRGDLVPEFESALFALKVGEISAVVETPFGYHIILREE